MSSQIGPQDIVCMRTRDGIAVLTTIELGAEYCVADNLEAEFECLSRNYGFYPLALRFSRYQDPRTLIFIAVPFPD